MVLCARETWLTLGKRLTKHYQLCVLMDLGQPSLLFLVNYFFIVEDGVLLLSTVPSFCPSTPNSVFYSLVPDAQRCVSGLNGDNFCPLLVPFNIFSLVEKGKEWNGTYLGMSVSLSPPRWTWEYGGPALGQVWTGIWASWPAALVPVLLSLGGPQLTTSAVVSFSEA